MTSHLKPRYIHVVSHPLHSGSFDSAAFEADNYSDNYADNYIVEHHSKFSDIYNSLSIPKDTVENSFIDPVKIIVFYVKGYALTEVEKDISTFRNSVKENNFTLLYIADDAFICATNSLVSYTDDFLNECHSQDVFRIKIQQLFDRAENYKKINRDLNEASEIALLSMSNSSELGEIARFILKSYECKNYEELIQEVFITVAHFGIKSSALIVIDGDRIFQSETADPVNIQKIMLQRHNTDRIVLLDNGIIIGFEHASLMLHNLPVSADDGRVVDNLTILGNCFDERVKGIQAEQAASAASHAKTLFLATMSHELRTPLNSVIGFTERLIKKLDGRLNEREERHLEAIKRNGDHLLSLINDILDMSKIDVGKMDINPEVIEAVDQVKTIHTQLQPMAKKQNLDFGFKSAEKPILVNADPTRFIQIVMNLITNAIKYTENGFVNITVATSNDSDLGPCLCMAIEDSGIGISPADQQRLFGRFVQIDSELSRKVEGTGLGLAISMAFAKMHGGRIDVSSEEGIGSCFSLLIPLTDQGSLAIIKRNDQIKAGFFAIARSNSANGAFLIKSLSSQLVYKICQLCPSVYGLKSEHIDGILLGKWIDIRSYCTFIAREPCLTDNSHAVAASQN